MEVSVKSMSSKSYQDVEVKVFTGSEKAFRNKDKDNYYSSNTKLCFRAFKKYNMPQKKSPFILKTIRGDLHFFHIHSFNKYWEILLFNYLLMHIG